MRASHRVAKNTLILYGKTGITMFLSLYTTRVVLRELGADDFGIFALIGGVIAMFGFLNGSMAAATQRFMSYAHGKGEESEQKSIFNISFVLHACAGVLVVAILGLIGPILFEYVFQIEESRIPTAKLIYYCVVASVLFPVISVPYNAVLIARENMLFVAVTGFIESVLKFGVAVSLTYHAGNKLLLFGGLMAGIPVVLMLVQASFCHWRYAECKFSLPGLKNRSLAKEMTGFAGWSFLGSASSILSQKGQGVVLNYFFGTALNAAQGITNQVSGQLSVLATSLEKAINPVITKREGAGQRNSMLQAALTGSKFTFILKAVLFVPAILEMPYLFSIWLTDIPDYAIVFCRLYLVKNLIESLMVGLNLAIKSVGNIKWYQIVSSLIEATPLLISIVLFSAGFEPYTMYIVFIVSTGILLMAQILFCWKLCSLSITVFLGDVLLRIAVSMLITTSICFIPIISIVPGSGRLMITFAISSIVLIASFFLVTCTNEERFLINTSIREAIRKLFSAQPA